MRATAADTSWTPSTRRCAGCRPTSSTCTNSTSTTGTFPLEESLQALDDLVRVGKVRYVGCSNFLAYRLAQALGKSATLGLARFDSVQPRYNLLFREFERELFPLCLDEGVGRDPLQPDRGRPALGQARPYEAAGGRDALHARERGRDVPGPLLARQRVRHRRPAREGRRRRGYPLADARSRVDARNTPRSPHRSSARAVRNSSTRRVRRSTRSSSPISCRR